MWIWDAVGFALVAFLLGSFAFWLVGYMVVEAIRHWVRGPSMQYRSLGTTVSETMGEPSGVPVGPVTDPDSRRRAA